MIIVDENVPVSQLDQLRRWRIRYRHIGANLASKGISDQAIIPLLIEHSNSTLFTLDRDFIRRDLCHQRYAICNCSASGMERQEPRRA